MATTTDLYAVLGVAPTATAPEIKKAWIDLGRKWHPDKHGGSAEATRRSTEINDAYKVLGNAANRAKYDAERGVSRSNASGTTGGATGAGTGKEPVGGGSGEKPRRPPPPDDMIGRMMGDLLTGGRTIGQPRRPVPGAAAPVGGGLPIIELTYEQAYAGNAALPVPLSGGASVPCGACKGSGNAARGAGLGMKTQCAACRGTGKVTGQTVTVKIPSRAYDGMTVMAAGEGATGGIGAPAACVRLKKHARYVRENETTGDLSVAVDTPYTVLILGGSLPVQTLDGTRTLPIPAGTQSGEKLRLSGLGLGTQGGRTGDLWVTLRAFLPTQISERERGLLAEIARLRGDPARGA